MLLSYLLSDSGSPAAVDTHDVPIIPAAAAVISGFNSVPAVVGFPACCCFSAVLGTLAIIPTFAGTVYPYSVGRPVVAFIPAIACIR
jgi:hypothetical protein